MTTLSLADKRNKAAVARRNIIICSNPTAILSDDPKSIDRLVYWGEQYRFWQAQVEADESAIARALLETVPGVGGGG